MGSVAVNRRGSLQEQVEDLAVEAVTFHGDADPVERLPGIRPNPSAPPKEPPEMSFAQDPELVSEFLVETREHMANVEKQLLVLEQNPADTEAVHAVFRAFHSTKGVAGFLELRNVGEFCQEVETVLDRVRTGAMRATPEVIDLILEAVDWVRLAATQIEQSQPDGRAAPELLARIRSLAGRGQPAIALPAPPDASALPPSVTPDGSPRAVKIDTAKLDYLVEMAGELVIAHSMVQHNPALAEIAEPSLLQGLAQLSRVTTEVQRTVMGMRMVPISTLFDRMERLVRELTRKSGKKAELQVTGGETELDRNIVEELSEPLVHMIRNALDHGIESPAERAASGKNPIGQVGLSASHLAGQILVGVSDDGRGLDRDKILQKAVACGLASAGAELSDEEVFEFIFHPGFSTADRVTDVSGRGVGMDVVRKKLQALRGRMHIESTRGKGTWLLAKLPLTLAIIDGMLIGVGAERYVVPVSAVREVLRPVPEACHTLRGGEFVMIRGSALPLVRLARAFAVPGAVEDPCAGLLIVVESGLEKRCLLADRLVGIQEIVIKSLAESVKHIPGISGSAILGDGHVSLILDIDGLLGHEVTY
ncbi:MAG: chemotaxis protein CheA [Bryobacteraceae bacterium]